MAIECPDCRDCSRYATDAYKPFCKIENREVSTSHFERYCKRYPQYRECPIRRKHFDW